MTERSGFDAFEQRLAADLERYVAPASDSKSPSEIAQVAMRPRGLVARAHNTSRRRRLLILLAAVLLVPAAYIAAGGIKLPAPTLTATDLAVFIRRDEGAVPGLSIVAVRPDGGEQVIRTLPDSLVPGRGRLSEWGTVSESGWLALSVEVNGGPWPMILVNLREPEAEPWVVEEANLGGIGPRWGPTGLIVAFHDWETLLIADPATQETRMLPLRGRGLVGGGPSIVWTGDGTGIVGSTDTGGYEIVPIDGGPARPGVGAVIDQRGIYGPGMTELRICSPDVACRGAQDGRVERLAPNGNAETVWRQDGDDRALAASFGDREGEYWLTLDHDAGRQAVLVRVQDGRQDTMATVNRRADWQYIGAPLEAPDQSAVVLLLDLGAKPAAVIVRSESAVHSFHPGHFAGFIGAPASEAFASGSYGAPAISMPAAGERYALPALDKLVAAELALNPGRTVLDKASRDGVEGDAEMRTFEIAREQPGAGELYLDCFGPSSVTVRSGTYSTTSPCLRAGSYGIQVDPTAPVIVTTSGETSWRVVVYTSP